MSIVRQSIQFNVKVSRYEENPEIEVPNITLVKDSKSIWNDGRDYVTDENFYLSKKSMYSAIIQYAIQELSIINNAYQKFVGNQGARPLHYMPLDQRYGRASGENYGELRINSAYTNAHKLQRDVQTMIHLLTTIDNEMLATGTYNRLFDSLTALTSMLEESNVLLHTLKGQEKLSSQLRKIISKERAAGRSVLASVEDRIASQKMTIETVRVYCLAERTYYERWERSRSAQNAKSLGNTTNYLKYTCEMSLRDMERERLCHEQIEKFVEESRIDTLDEIDNWMVKYEKDIDELFIDIEHQGHALEKLDEKYEQTQLLFATRKQEMADWREYKRIQKEKEIRAALEMKAAMKIADWWIEIMMRRKIGRFKVKKGKNKDKKGAKKRKG